MNTPTFHTLTNAQFKRVLGVSRSTFMELLSHLQTFKGGRGRPCKLSAESQLTLGLTYWRDYPSLLTLGTQYGISEASAWRVVRRVEDRLMSSGLLSLPKTPSGMGLERPVVTLVDATEILIERPKKTAALV
ncbi:transposase family protein [Thiolinea disciformis]|uniref:transposase family protein n=1 Tax=Thiolinea disciformis TaxID=125614 RepID=UPI0003696CD8|nr:transposase family protein [Thiolinea disciformis]